MRLLLQVCSGPSAAIACWQGKRCEPDRLYQRVWDDLDALLQAVGPKLAA